MPFIQRYSPKPLAKVIDIAARRHLHQVPGAPRHNNHNVYVTGAGVRSQQRCGFKYEGYLFQTEFMFKIVDIRSTFIEVLVCHNQLVQFDIGFDVTDQQFA